MIAVLFFIVLQLATLAILRFGDIGFDHPGRFGLDYDDAIMLIVAYVILLIAGLIAAALSKQWRLLLLQFAIPIGAYAINGAVDKWQKRPIDPADYQHLVGMTKAEVREELWTHKPVTSGGATGDHEFDRYNGMEVQYSLIRARGDVSRVLRVQSCETRYQ